MALIDVLNNDKNHVVLSLIKRGIISHTITNKKTYYEYYMRKCEEYKQKETRFKMIALLATEEEFKICSKTVYNAIKLMES